MRLLDPDDTRPPYVQIADAIRDDIINGNYEPGAPLPSRTAAAEEFGVAPMTIQNAWRVLRDEGTIVTRQGSGVYVRQIPGKPRDPLAEVDNLRTEIAALRERIEQLEDAAPMSARRATLNQMTRDAQEGGYADTIDEFIDTRGPNKGNPVNERDQGDR